MGHHRHLLLVEDDELLRVALAGQLHDAMGFTVTQVATNAQAVAATAHGARFDAVILDVRMPDGDGRDLCERLRRDGLKAPIIILSGIGREADVVRGLDAGANDYVVKPFRVAELAARLRAQMRTFESSEHAEIPIGPFTFRPGPKTLQEHGGRPVRLTEKEAAVLKFLYRADGAAVPRDTLLAEVWGYSAEASTHTVETHIYRLRRKIEPRADSPRLLVSEAGGYRLMLPRAQRPLGETATTSGTAGEPSAERARQPSLPWAVSEDALA